MAAVGYEFVPPTPETHRRVNTRRGNEEARDLRDVFGWSRPFRPGTVGQNLFAILAAGDVVERAGELWRSRVRIASLNGRLYLHSAFPTFEPDAVFFGPDTYRFVRAALAGLPDRAYPRAVDLGCGSGAGGLSVAAARPIGQLWLSDINPDALTFARANAAHAGQAATCIESDLFVALDGTFGLILANPPYLADPGRRAYRDGGGPLGMDLGLRIVREGITRLTESGVLFLYTGVPIADGLDQFRLEVEQIVPRRGFGIDYSEIDPDVFGEELDMPAYRAIDRIAVIALMITRTG
ncbi:MAG: HemK family modification methylase [Rhodospirillales bacterium]|nr:HemK family modification methylase [Rhodospirillales bacterium]